MAILHSSAAREKDSEARLAQSVHFSLSSQATLLYRGNRVSYLTVVLSRAGRTALLRGKVSTVLWKVSVSDSIDRYKTLKNVPGVEIWAVE
jgi:hypothetical protein